MFRRGLGSFHREATKVSLHADHLRQGTNESTMALFLVFVRRTGQQVQAMIGAMQHAVFRDNIRDLG